MEVISDEDAEEYIKTNYQRLISETKPNGVYPHDWHRQAQRDADMEEMREILDKIERHFRLNASHYTHISEFDINWWNKTKNQILGGN